MICVQDTLKDYRRFCRMLYIDILFFVVLAIFLAFRLNDILGKEIDTEQKINPIKKTDQKEQKQAKNIFQKPEGTSNVVEIPALKGLAELKKHIKFNMKTFIPAVESAYETIVKAFAENDIETLRFLLADDIFEDFESALKEKNTKKEKDLSKLTTVLIRSVKIIDIDIKKTHVYLTIRFDAEHVVEENGSDDAQHHQDVWTFVKEKGKKDKHWDLYATQSENKEQE